MRPLYTALHGKSIRVFRLHPARNASSSISGSLHETCLQNPVAYDALSYQWGASKPDFYISVGKGSLSVSKNCHDALLRLRHPTRERTLWLDAICIDQSDEEDKNHQVSLMADIYLEADSVIVWLGERTPASDYALAWCQYASRMSFNWPVAKVHYRPNLLQAKERRRVTVWFRERCAGYALRLRSRLSMDPRMQYQPGAMQDLYARGWFTRTWTIQEVALASMPLVMCGGKTILWGNLMGGLDVAFTHDNTDRTRSARNAVQCIEILWLRLLDQSWDDSDARFYNMALTLFWAGSREKTLRRFRVLKKACVCILLLLVVGMAIYRFNKSNWRLENDEWDAWMFIVLAFSLCFILAFFNPPEEFAQGRQQLLRETLINTINLVRPRRATDLRDKVFALYGAFQMLGITLDAPEYGHNTVANVYSRFAQRIIAWQGNLDLLIEASLPSYPATPTWVPDLSREYRRWEIQHFKAAGDSAPDFTCSARILRTKGLLLGVVTDSWAVASDWNFGFLTREMKYKGITPGSVQVGDVMVLIAGLRVPMLLRGGSEGYQVVGMAEVGAIMNGEAWDDEVSKTWFDLV